ASAPRRAAARGQGRTSPPSDARRGPPLMRTVVSRRLRSWLSVSPVGSRLDPLQKRRAADEDAPTQSSYTRKPPPLHRRVVRGFARPQYVGYLVRREVHRGSPFVLSAWHHLILHRFLVIGQVAAP